MNHQIPSTDHFGEYRSKSGRFHFCWFFERRPTGEVRAYILHAPGYGNPTTESAFKHWRRSENANGGDPNRSPFPYVAHDPVLRDFSEAIAKARDWAERVEKYAVSSGEFHDPK